MADRRAGPEDDGYDWLYAQGDDPARMPPPPSYIAPNPQTDRQTDPRTDRPSGADPRGSRTRGRLPRFRLRWLLWLLVAWVVFLVAVPVYAWTSVSRVDGDPGGDRPGDQPGTTYLVVGSDARKGLPGR